MFRNTVWVVLLLIPSKLRFVPLTPVEICQKRCHKRHIFKKIYNICNIFNKILIKTYNLNLIWTLYYTKHYINVPQTILASSFSMFLSPDSTEFMIYAIPKTKCPFSICIYKFYYTWRLNTHTLPQKTVSKCACQRRLQHFGHHLRFRT